MSVNGHEPVMTREVVQALNVQADGTYVDATFGRGGHTRAILSCLGPVGRVLAIDRDPEAHRCAKQMSETENRLTFVQASFSELFEMVNSHGLVHRVTGLVLDLGVSSPQLDSHERGFSFKGDGPLDMRMNPDMGQSAAEWLNTVTEERLRNCLRELGEERYSRRIARSVVAARTSQPLSRTLELADIVANAVPTREPGKHPATRTFQAIRMQVNQELGELKSVLPQALSVLEPGGRLVVISFHSLEHRAVKQFLRQAASGDRYPPDLPVTHDQIRPAVKILSKPLRPGQQEVETNPRARSAVLRAAEKTGHADS